MVPHLLGAHVSTAGGVQTAPARGAQIGAAAIQIFTKQPSRWAEPDIPAERVATYRDTVAAHGFGWSNAHDSYLINLASPDAGLAERSFACFRGELRRAALLGLDAVVTHPGNATDGDRDHGVARNAELLERALEDVPGDTLVLVETTAGAGSALGATFVEVAEMIERISAPLRHRVGVCFDTCHVFAAGYDLRGDYDGVMREFDYQVGLERLRLFHLNDSLRPLGSRRDRHAGIGEGELGELPFRRLMTDPRFADVPKLLETPKGDDLTSDLRNLARLRSFCD
ncbi:deoxyribonuclease IV [soil metagenome]